MRVEASSRIARVRCDILRTPTIRPHALAMATMREQRSVLVRIEAADGLIGCGEAATIGGLAYSDESPDGIKLTIDRYAGPLLLDAPDARFGALLGRLAATMVGNPFAKMAIETALLDLAGQRAGLPVSELLGGRLHNHLEVVWTLASGDVDRDIEEARVLVASRRHRHFKIKIGRRPWREDVRRCALIADALTETGTVRVDVNQSWDLATAKQAAPALAEAGVAMIEQPLPVGNAAGAALLRRQVPASIVADEALRGGVPAALQVLRDEAADGFSLKIAQAGGLFACRAVAEIGRAAGLDLYGGTMLEGSIATAASAHLFSTLDRLTWDCELFGPLLQTHDLLRKPLVYRDFSLEVPDGPGLGVALDDAAVAEAIARENAAVE